MTNICQVTAVGTRTRLRAAALELFVRQGYDQTTVAQIAAAAGVTPMTFFRHFATKERVLLDDPYDPGIAAAVARQESTLPVLERVRRGLLSAWAEIALEEDEELRIRLRIGAGHAGLRARMREDNQATESAIVEALVRTGTPRFDAAVAAGAVLGALTAALLEWAATPEPRALGSAITRALDLLALEATDD
ncbi:MAG: Transcriptional regulator, AcrR family [uncultured Friedmanniella sp.]|uniref:Transcriptional regulator, AcrR family n=1 Tax=uncultured Friedmanniella sp. TaxID=335381 RepID=A0A6J4K212_9ACTN|nr:MAG: Transcriptional regulator, AcrR family [uncultured Friedmanniella sp.]